MAKPITMYNRRTNKRQNRELERSDKEFDAINKTRVACGLPAIVKAVKKCLRCEAEFVSLLRNGNFLCAYCSAYLAVRDEEPLDYG